MTDESSQPVEVALYGVTKRFGEMTAVDNVTLEIKRGEFFSMLGPSGCGKTTSLRMIAGFEEPDAGRVELTGRDIVGVPPFKRNVNTVFQSYALFPHLTVADNVAFGLKRKKVPKSEVKDRVKRYLDLVQLPGYDDRRPSQLSGGQQQRVALARALVNEPAVLLLDEPLGALDLKLREEMQGELKRIQREVGVTFIYVTHDQDEALAMSDRLAVFSNGSIEQVGAPAEVYERPASAFVAGFVGTSNIIIGDLARTLRGSPEPFTVRPEKITLIPHGTAADPAHGDIRVSGTVRSALYLGERTRYTIDLDAGGQLVAVAQNRASATPEATAPGRAVRLAWDRQWDRLLPDRSAAAPTTEPEGDM